MSASESLTIDKDGVAQLAGVSKDTIDRLVKAGKFPAPMKPTPRIRLWPRATVVAFIQNGMQSPSNGGAA